jgi:hypothetical protein
MSDEPNEQELKAAAWLKVYGFPPEWWTEPERVKSIAIAIATHTRYDGKTAEEWARLQQQTAFVVSEVNLRAEAAEAKVKELEAKLDAAIAEAKRETTPARCERHKCVIPSLNSICEICDMEEAIAEAVSQRTVECAGICTTKHFASDAARDILALDAPPAPVYPFQKPCKCWHTCEPWNGKRWFRDFPGKDLELASDAAFCEVCGAPRTKADTRIAELKQDCADAAEAALQAAPDYEAMHTMVRAAIMQVGNR